MKTLTLKNIPDDLAIILGDIAKQKHQSIDETAIQVIRQSLALFQVNKRNRNLSVFFGGWSKHDAEDFENKISIFERVDEELWRK